MVRLRLKTSQVRWGINPYLTITDFSIIGEVPKVIEELIIPGESKNGDAIVGMLSLTKAINRLATRGCKEISRLVFNDKIVLVDLGALAYVKIVKSVVWPSKCKTIPEECFFNSSIENVENIDHVDTIKARAFAGSNIREVDWPVNAKTISTSTFLNSGLKVIRGIENVKTIFPEAFSKTQIKKFTWPNNCSTVNPRVFADCKRLDSVRLSESIEHIYFSAFDGCTSLPCVDLSSCCFLKAIHKSRRETPVVVQSYYSYYNEK